MYAVAGKAQAQPTRADGILRPGRDRAEPLFPPIGRVVRRIVHLVDDRGLTKPRRLHLHADRNGVTAEDLSVFVQREPKGRHVDHDFPIGRCGSLNRKRPPAEQRDEDCRHQRNDTYAGHDYPPIAIIAQGRLRHDAVGNHPPPRFTHPDVTLF